MVEGQASGPEPGRTDAAIRSRVDELVAAMTPAEKAGQLTQYFYFGFLPRRTPSPATAGSSASRPGVGRGGSGAGRGRLAAVRHRPGGDQPPAAARRRGQPARHPGAVRLRRDPRAAHDPPGADRDGGVLGSRDDRARAGRRRARGPRSGHPLDLRADGRHRPRSAVGPHHRGRRRGSVPRRGRRRGTGARLPGRGGSARPSASSPVPSTSPGTAPRSAAATTTRSTSPTPSCGTSTSRRSRRRSTAGAGNVMTAYMDLNGVPATGNRWLFTDVLRGDARLRGLRRQRRQRGAQSA